MAASRKIIVVLGPTASGKSDLAMALAKAGDGEILSVDSMQVYRGMDIGTAKPIPPERADVVHHLLDVAEPTETFTVARFVAAADAVIARAADRQTPLIATGGTPLYYKSLFHGLFDGPGADAEVRARLGAEEPAELAERLQQVDPAAAARIHPNDQRRLIRALEVYELTGKTISSHQNEWAAGQLRHPAIWIGLAWERDALNRRINARVRRMLAHGWLEEVRGLLQRHGDLSPTAAEATGYRELIAHVRGQMSLDEAAEQIKIATRQLARRQMKWFRRFADVNWITGDQPFDQLLSQALEHWRKNAGAA